MLTNCLPKYGVTPNWLTISIIPRTLKSNAHYQSFYKAIAPQLVPALKENTTNPPEDNGNHPQIFLNQFIYDYLRISDLDAYKIVKDLQSNGIEISTRLWGTLVKHFSWSKNDRICGELMSQEKVHRPHFLLNTYNIMMGICKQQREYHLIQEYVDEMSRRGILPDHVTYSIVLEAYTAIGWKEDFEKVAYSAQRAVVDTILSNKLLSGYLHFQMFENFAQAIEAMKVQSQRKY